MDRGGSALRRSKGPTRPRASARTNGRPRQRACRDRRRADLFRPARRPTGLRACQTVDGESPSTRGDAIDGLDRRAPRLEPPSSRSSKAASPGGGGATGQGRPEILAFTTFPKEHSRQLWSNNSLERLNKEIRRRSDAVGIFPDRASIVRASAPYSPSNTTSWPSAAAT